MVPNPQLDTERSFEPSRLRLWPPFRALANAIVVFVSRGVATRAMCDGMRLEHDGDERNVEDLRGQSGAGPGYGGLGSSGGGGGGVRLGLGGSAVVLVLSLVFGRNFFADLNGGGTSAGLGPLQQPRELPVVDPRSRTAGQGRPTEENELADRTKAVFNDSQRVWASEFRALGKPYSEAKLVLFTDRVTSGCGYAEAAMGPFYCPADHRVFVDMGFYRQLRTRFRAPGDFAQAYVVAHEVGHHIQGLLGTEERVRIEQRRRPDQKNPLSVRMELQADCYAGIWAHSTEQRQILDAGDVDEGLAAAAAVGDDRIQSEATGQVNPERWTHGSSKDRAAWFRRGFASGKLRDCDTFGAR
jgi:uncharacterized protein